MLHSLSLKKSWTSTSHHLALQIQIPHGNSPIMTYSMSWICSKLSTLSGVKLRDYIVLKTIDRLGDIEAFVVQGITDKWFPFTIPSFPNDIDLPTRRKLLENQWIVLTKA